MQRIRDIADLDHLGHVISMLACCSHVKLRRHRSFQGRWLPRVGPDDLSEPDDRGDGPVDGPLMVVHHEAHRTTRDHGGVEREVKRLQNPNAAQTHDDEAKQCADDSPIDVERSSHRCPIVSSAFSTRPAKNAVDVLVITALNGGYFFVSLSARAVDGGTWPFNRM